MTFFMMAPICAGDLLMVTPADSSALILSVAVPLPPAMMAPACPIRLPGGAVKPAVAHTHASHAGAVWQMQFTHCPFQSCACHVAHSRVVIITERHRCTTVCVIQQVSDQYMQASLATTGDCLYVWLLHQIMFRCPVSIAINRNAVPPG